MSFNIGTTVRLREELCLGRTDRIARGVIVEVKPAATSLDTEFKIWWDDGYAPEWFITDELELANDQELSLPLFGCA